MRGFGWIRLACLLLVLTALVRIGDTGAEARSLAARVPDVLALAPEEPEAPVVRRWTEDQISSLQDVSEEALRAHDAPGTTDPRPAATPPAPDAARQQRPAEGARAVSPSEPPVFYRPADPRAPADAGPVCGDLRGAPEGGRIVFPLERRFFASYEDTWGAPRAQGGHEGTDLMAPSGSPEYAITDGTVVPVAGSNADGWNTLGGHAVMVRADYSIGPVKAGDLFYYAHLQRESPLPIGSRVRAGQIVGYAGDTGQGPPGTSGLFPPHLHLGWYDGTGGREEAVSGAMNPYPLLEWIRANGGAVAGGSEARFCEAPRTGPPTPSAHDGAWPTPARPDKSPDLDATPKDPRPARANKSPEKDPDKRPATKRPPAKKPLRPDNPKKTVEETPKPEGEDRPEAPRHERPKKDPQRTTPDPGEDRKPLPPPDPPEKRPTGPTFRQYEFSTAAPPRPEAPRPDPDWKPKTEQGDAEDGKDAGNPSGRGS